MKINPLIRDRLNALNDAANALRGTSENVSLNQQIRNVSQELFKGREAKHIVSSKKELPKEAKVIFDEIFEQVRKIRKSAQQLTQKDSLTVIEDIKVLKDFAKRVFSHYKVDQSELAKRMNQALSHLISDGTEGVKLISMRKSVADAVKSYQNSTELTLEGFKTKIEKVSEELDAIIRTLPSKQELPLLYAEVSRLKNEIEAARKLYNREQSPGIEGEKAIQLLRVATDMIQDAKTYPEIIHSISLQEEANRHLENSGSDFKIRAEPFNLIFSEKIHSFLRRQIVKMRETLNAPMVFVPKDKKRNEDIYKTMALQKTLLRDYGKIAKKTGEHRRDIEELLDEIKEKIKSRVDKMIPHFTNGQVNKFQELKNL